MIQSTVFSNPGPAWTLHSILAGLLLLVVLAFLLVAVFLMAAGSAIRRRY